MRETDIFVFVTFFLLNIQKTFTKCIGIANEIHTMTNTEQPHLNQLNLLS